MKTIFNEYGRLLIALIIVLGFIGIVKIWISGDKTEDGSIANVYDNQGQNSEALYKNNDTEYYSGILGDTTESDTVPYFSIQDSDGKSYKESGNKVDLRIKNNVVKYEDLYKYVRIVYRGEDITDKEQTSDGKVIKKALLISEYKPVIIKEANDNNGHIQMVETDAKDKYGRYIYEADGKTHKKVMVPKLLESKQVEFLDNNYIDCTEETLQFRAVYRVQVESYKAECEITYIKNNIGENINADGLNKIKFEYSNTGE